MCVVRSAVYWTSLTALVLITLTPLFLSVPRSWLLGTTYVDMSDLLLAGFAIAVSLVLLVAFLSSQAWRRALLVAMGVGATAAVMAALLTRIAWEAGFPTPRLIHSLLGLDGEGALDGVLFELYSLSFVASALLLTLLVRWLRR